MLSSGQRNTFKHRDVIDLFLLKALLYRRRFAKKSARLRTSFEKDASKIDLKWYTSMTRPGPSTTYSPICYIIELCQHSTVTLNIQGDSNHCTHIVNEI